MAAEALMLIGGDWRRGTVQEPVVEPVRGEEALRVWLASAEQVDAAVQAARDAWDGFGTFPAHRRSTILAEAARLVAAQREEFARLMVATGGKVWKEALGEVDVSAEILRLSAEEARRIGGEVVPMDSHQAGEGRIAVTMRFPLGVVAAITPFNAPLSVTCNKIGPALAAGNCVVHKPDLRGSAVGARLATIFLEAGLPPGALNVIYGDAEVGEALVTHSGIDLVNFTGSNRVGARIVAIAGLKRVVLELGGTGATVVHVDANLRTAAKMCIPAAFGLAGQSCVSTQRLYVHRAVGDAFLAQFLPLVDALQVGDPMDPQTDLGPMVSEEAARRVEGWVQEAVASGARVLRGGERRGALLPPTVLTDAQPEMRVVCEEVFGPIVTILPYDDVDDVLAAVNDTPFGLQAGLFTASLDVALRALRTIRTGTVVINGPSRWRVYHMPYGGVKASGWGREGPRYSVEDMMEERLLVIGSAGH
jgi:acyl-CoA reductase-like NAD-dependent aldehyde dehydrogenase